MTWWQSLLIAMTFMFFATGVIWKTHSFETSYASAPITNLDHSQSFDILEGKRLFGWFNCGSCHANGGGNIGPALTDSQWIYGTDEKDIFASILDGRPNGMPAFKGRIPEKQILQLVAYIRSISGHAPFYARPSRSDHINAKKPEL
jgi:cytochrome c oxidase cbb3-type subunit 3